MKVLGTLPVIDDPWSKSGLRFELRVAAATKCKIIRSYMFVALLTYMQVQTCTYVRLLIEHLRLHCCSIEAVAYFIPNIFLNFNTHAMRLSLCTDCFQ